MDSQSKTHYRKVFKSDHLGVADLEDYKETGSSLIYTIAHVRQEMGTRVAGKKIDANIAYFVESIKPLVLNATNSRVMKDLSGSCFVENWNNITVQLYIDPTAKLKGEVVGGVRINPNPVKTQRPVITSATEKMWNNAKAAYKRDGDLKKVLERADMSQEDQADLIAECDNA